VLNCVAAAGTALVLSTAYAQDIKQPMLDKPGAKAYCSGELKDLSGKPFQAMVEAEQISDDIVLFRIRKRFNGAYKFPNIREEFPYVSADKYIICVNGPTFGDDAADYVLEPDGEVSFRSADPKQLNLTPGHNITPEHERLVSSAVRCIAEQK